MSAGASPTPGVASSASAGGPGNRVRQFWQRVSEGRQLDDLWSQFAADARASYGFYGADIAFATRPQNSVAGDYYDAFYPDERRNRLVVVIADVAGKSVPAALLMATLQASLRTIAGEGVPVAELVTRLNRYASAYSLDGRRFTTAVLCDYDPATRQLTYVNAGHNAPILRRANGAFETLEVGGLPLGIKVGAEYETASLELRPGDALILFTDGVIEAFNASGEEFGNERWLATVRGLPDWSGHLCLRCLLERVDQFVGGKRQA